MERGYDLRAFLLRAHLAIIETTSIESGLPNNTCSSPWIATPIIFL